MSAQTKDSILGIAEEIRANASAQGPNGHLYWLAVADRLEAAYKADRKGMRAFLWNIVQEATDGDKSEGMRLGWILASVSTALGSTVGSALAKEGAE